MKKALLLTAFFIATVSSFAVQDDTTLKNNVAHLASFEYQNNIDTSCKSMLTHVVINLNVPKVKGMMNELNIQLNNFKVRFNTEMVKAQNEITTQFIIENRSRILQNSIVKMTNNTENVLNEADSEIELKMNGIILEQSAKINSDLIAEANLEIENTLSVDALKYAANNGIEESILNSDEEIMNQMNQSSLKQISHILHQSTLNALQHADIEVSKKINEQALLSIRHTFTNQNSEVIRNADVEISTRFSK